MSETTTDHKKIKDWAERHGGKPAAVARTHENKDVGIIRIMFPQSTRSEHEGLTEISWDEFFEEFEQRSLALVYDEDSRFSKLVGRESAGDRAHSGRHEHGDRGSRGH
jgi:hypothetical protein